jgi:hypothetical protein
LPSGAASPPLTHAPPAAAVIGMIAILHTHMPIPLYITYLHFAGRSAWRGSCSVVSVISFRIA